MNGYRSILALIPFFCVPTLSQAWAYCDSQMSSYETAKASFSNDVREKYSIDLSNNDFNLEVVDDFRASALVEKTENFATLMEIVAASKFAHQDMQVQLDILSTSVNHIFLRTRPLPQLFVTGAELSFCLSEREQVEFARLTDIMTENIPEFDLDVSDGSAALKEYAEVLEQASAMRDDFSESREQTTNPSEIVLLASAEELLDSSTDYLKTAAFLRNNREELKETIEVGLNMMAISFILSPSRNERETLNNEIVQVFDKNLDFGYWEMEVNK